MNIDVQVASRAQGIPSRGEIRQWIVAALDSMQSGPGRQVTVRVVDEDEIRSLNREYRQQDKPTNVLSFPASAVPGLPDEEQSALGDIVICAAVVASEAAEQGKSVVDHWGHMIVHGTLHLLGYDHATDSEAAEMEGLERRILAGVGIADPYERN